MPMSKTTATEARMQPMEEHRELLRISKEGVMFNAEGLAYKMLTEQATM